MSPQGDMVIVPAQARFATIVLARDYYAWCEDPGNFASCVIKSPTQIDLLVIAIAAHASFALEEREAGLLLTFLFSNGLSLAVPVAREDSIAPVDLDHDFVVPPPVIVHCEVTINVLSGMSQIGGQHGHN